MSDKKTVGVGVVGLGFRGLDNLATRIAETSLETGLRITAVCDREPGKLSRAPEYLKECFGKQGIRVTPTPYDNHESLINDPRVDVVMVTTPQCAHRDPAVAALRAGKKVYVDKPIAHTLGDAMDIAMAQRECNSPVLMGFTRRYETTWNRAYDLLESGTIGTLHMIVIRDIIPFHTFFHRWHRRMKWSGGALNDKSSHHCDILNWFAGSRPERLAAFGGRRVFLEQPDAPVRCHECSRECPYRIGSTRGKTVSQEEMALEDATWTAAREEFQRVDNCVFAPGADIKDHATIQVSYENGILGTLIVSFFGPKAEDQETMELVGTSGRIVLNRHEGSIKVIAEYGKLIDVIDCTEDDFSSSHFGADLELSREIRRFADGAAPIVSAEEGFEATRMIMAAHKAIDAGGTTIVMSDMPGLA